MIHHCYFEQLRRASTQIYPYASGQVSAEYALVARVKAMYPPKFNMREYMGQRIRDSQDDSFIFITTKSQDEEFSKWLEEESLKDLITTQSEYIQNHNYPEHGPKLKITVIQSKNHFQRDELKSPALAG